MVKRILLTLVQFIAFIALLAVGGNWDFINLNMEMRQLQQGRYAACDFADHQGCRLERIR